MKLVINYDFFNAIRDVNEPLTPMKIVRNNRKYKFLAPVTLGIGYLGGMSPESIARYLILWYGIYITTDLALDNAIKRLNNNVDSYALTASTRLKNLSLKLDDINVKTNYDMLLKSELYEKNHKLELSNDIIPTLTEQKYIYVPSYGFDGQEKETSILQEHDIGSSVYTLSVGEPEKQYRRVLVNNHA